MRPALSAWCNHRWMLASTWAFGFILCVQPAIAKEPAPDVVAKFAIDPIHEAVVRVIASSSPDGVVRLQPLDRTIAEETQRVPVTEGLYLGLLRSTGGGPFLFRDASLVRVQVTDVDKDGVLTISLGKEALAKAMEGLYLSLHRPLLTTTAQMKSVPDWSRLEVGPSPEPKANDQRRQLAKSLNNLKEISLAMLTFENAQGRFPPAALRGPDGKPWHSWRVLLLPYLEMQELYNQYRFDEPWDSPNNRRLIDKMPPVYSDPVYGENREHYTHYAVIAGPETAFAADGPKFDGKTLAAGGIKMRQFVDGSSNSVLVASVSPDEKIPWTKPQDLMLPAGAFPDLGAKGNIATPYLIQNKKCAPFAMADGSVHVFSQATGKAVLRSLLTIGSRDPFEWSDVDVPRNPSANRSAARYPNAIYLLRQGGQIKARFVKEESEPS